MMDKNEAEWPHYFLPLDEPKIKKNRKITIYKRTAVYGQFALTIGTFGIAAEYRRPKVGGGWYVRDSVMVPWPWQKVS